MIAYMANMYDETIKASRYATISLNEGAYVLSVIWHRKTRKK